VRLSLAALLWTFTLPAQGPGPFVFPADWHERDLEGRWVVYRADRDANARDEKRLEQWARALRQRKEFEFLEWIAIHEGWREAGGALAAADAPQWMRTALWNVANLDSHDRDGAKKALLAAGGRARGWFEKYPSARAGRGELVLPALAKVEPVDPGDQLPPLDGAMVFLPYLDGGRLAEFGDRKTAEKGVRYVHQVVRALGSLTVWGEIEPPHVGKVVRLMRHERPEVFMAAAAVLTKLPGHLLPLDDLWRMTQEGDAPARQRAMLAFSYGTHPRVFFALHRTAVGGDEALAKVALQRLAEVGSPFTASWLEKAAVPGGASASWEDLRAQAIRNIRKRPPIPADAGEMLRWLEREAWSGRSEEPLANDYREWLRGLAGGERAAELRRSAALLDGVVPPSPHFDRQEGEAIAAAVRLRLKELLASPAGR
jgi:hypothetical protein